MYATERGRSSLRGRALYPAAVPEGCCAGKWARTWPRREHPGVPPVRMGAEASGYNLEGCHLCSARRTLTDAAGDRN